VAAFKLAIVVKRLPKTRSGKILRGTVKRIADGLRLHRAPATIDDPAILDEGHRLFEGRSAIRRRASGCGKLA
jgi:propionyl-CoA synthetase